MATILVYSSSEAGHTFPLVPGLTALAARGHDIQMRVTGKHVMSMREAGFAAAPVDPRIEDVEVTDYKAKSGGDRLRQGVRDLLMRGDIEMPDFEKSVAEVQPDAVIIDAINYGALTSAEAMGIPCSLFMPSLLPLRGEGIPAYGLGHAPMGGPLGKLRDAAFWKLSEHLYGKAMLPGLNGLREQRGLDPFESPFDLFTNPDRVIVTSAEPLEYGRTDLPEKIRMVGPQLWDPPAETPAWLDEPGDPWVLVTCSTHYQGDEQLALTAAEALRDEPYRVLVTTADAFDGRPPASHGNVRFESFVPHGKVLERAAGVICHGGMGIVQKSLYESVPMVVVPFGRDQPEVARRVTEAGAGTSLPFKKLNPEILRRKFREAIAMREQVQEAAERFRTAATTDGFTEAVESTLPAGTSLANEQQRLERLRDLIAEREASIERAESLFS